MIFSILVPHYRTGKMTAYAVSQLLKFKGKHEIEIIVIDNKYDDGSMEYLRPFIGEIGYITYPLDKLQSHGIAFDHALSLGLVTSEYFITLESDSFPIREGWLDKYESLINEGYDYGGSLLFLSGGEYVHPCGSFYRKSLWEEAKEYVNKIEYHYFPNMSRYSDFDCHLMVHNRGLEEFLNDPDDYIILSKEYIGLTKEQILAKRDYYLPISKSVFHNGMGNSQESLKTYGKRCIASETGNILLDNKAPLLNRIGFEPGQWFSYWLIANNKKGAVIPTEIKWMRNRGGQQQEYTLMENGLKHLWSVSAYHGNTNPEFQDIVTFKNKVVEDLYNSLPENQKIQI